MIHPSPSHLALWMRKSEGYALVPSARQSDALAQVRHAPAVFCGRRRLVSDVLTWRRRYGLMTLLISPCDTDSWAPRP